jgi:hypothetical protein
MLVFEENEDVSTPATVTRSPAPPQPEEWEKALPCFTDGGTETERDGVTTRESAVRLQPRSAGVGCPSALRDTRTLSSVMSENHSHPERSGFSATGLMAKPTKSPGHRFMTTAQVGFSHRGIMGPVALCSCLFCWASCFEVHPRCSM